MRQIKTLRAGWVMWVMSGFVFPSAAHALDYAVDVHGGTTGLGVGGTIGLIRHFNARFGINTGSLNYDFEEEGLRYEADFDIDNKYFLLDWYPFRRSNFRASAGMVANSTTFTATATIDSAVGIGGTTINTGSATTTISFASAATYYGVGWGNAIGRRTRFGFSVDVGLLAQGEPTVDLRVNDPSGTVSVDDVELERQDIAEEVDALKFFPAISVGVSYHF